MGAEHRLFEEEGGVDDGTRLPAHFIWHASKQAGRQASKPGSDFQPSHLVIATGHVLERELLVVLSAVLSMAGHAAMPQVEDVDNLTYLQAS